jgi:ubiquinone biosynthesis UbiH/UbiF/VisC/COQ6 family hydroxylase
LKKTRESDVLILGGGLVGLTLACALKDHGLRVDVFERSEQEPRLSLERDCRVSAIVAGSVRLLEGIDVWEGVSAQAGPIRCMRIWDHQNFGSIRFEAEEAGLDALGYIVENSILRDSMLETLEGAENTTIHCPAEAVSCTWRADHVRLELGDGRIFRAPLIVGADGGRSWLREQAGIGVVSRDFRQHGIVATVRPQSPHRGTAFQRFLPTGPLAMLPLSGDLCSMVWSAGNTRAMRLMKMDDDRFLRELNLAFGPVLGRLEEIGERSAFPLCARLAHHHVRPRLALIGDAAHTIHPLAGLGANLGFRDAMVLAQEIVDAVRFEEDIGSIEVLQRYAKARLPDTLSVMAGMEGFHQLFTRNWQPLVLLRDLGMLAVGNAGPFKHMIMRNGMGLAQPVPHQIT